MTDDEFLSLLKTQLGTVRLRTRASKAFDLPIGIVDAWLAGDRSPSPHAVHTLETVRAMDPRDLPIAWQHWDCRTDLHDDAAREAAAKRGGKAAEQKRTAPTVKEELKLYKDTARKAKAALTK